jgi:uncharacterized protein (TIGR00369 family)
MTDPGKLSRAELEAWLSEGAFHQVLGLKLESFDVAAQTVVIRCPYGPNVERIPGTGQYHGGVIASLIDVAGDFALVAVLGHAVPTINLRVDFVRPASASDLLARAQVRRAGRTVGVVDIEVQDSAGKLIALGRACYGTAPG